ncbi:MAG: uncharacterized membrane protein YhaH (DUF805 family) [Flammeovirgaceae bacterium]|jgi:uncharacterized membrane protein YhaH (DUF805 family)
MIENALHVVRDNFANFEGRARRKEYWMFYLFNILVYIVLGGLGAALESSLFMGLVGLFALVVLVPSIAVGVRRMHDIGKSGWYLMVTFIPLVGTIWLLVLLVTEGEIGENIYGEDPKALEANF